MRETRETLKPLKARGREELTAANELLQKALLPSRFQGRTMTTGCFLRFLEENDIRGEDRLQCLASADLLGETDRLGDRKWVRKWNG